MKILPLLTLLLVAAPASGQSRVYTNADLGRPLSPERVTVTPTPIEAITILSAHVRPFAGELRDTRSRDWGPSFGVVDTTPTFTRSTDALIATPANFTTDMYAANAAAIYQTRLAGRGYGHRRR
jgi:hypothetical protein